MTDVNKFIIVFVTMWITTFMNHASNIDDSIVFNKLKNLIVVKI